MKEIPLNKGKVALVDDEDYDTLTQYTWYVVKRYQSLYARRSVYNSETKENRNG